MLMSEWTVSTSFKHVTMWEKHHPGHISMDKNPLCFWRRYMLTCKMGGKKETKVAESVKYLKASSDRLSFASFLCCVHTTLLSESSARWALHTPQPHDVTNCSTRSPIVLHQKLTQEVTQKMHQHKPQADVAKHGHGAEKSSPGRSGRKSSWPDWIFSMLDI